jgi:uncharacterized membrane protein
MNKDLDIFLKRMFLYRAQYLCSAICAFTMWIGIAALLMIIKVSNDIGGNFLVTSPILIFTLFNTVTYFYSKYLAKKYGIEMFGDLDQEWLREHQAFDSKAFGEIFTRLIQCRKIAGPYMLAVIVPLAFINMYLAAGVGVIYIIAYFVYRMTYFDTAISYKIPRAMGGGGIVVSKIIDEEFNKKLDDLNKKLTTK